MLSGDSLSERHRTTLPTIRPCEVVPAFHDQYALWSHPVASGGFLACVRKTFEASLRGCHTPRLALGTLISDLPSPRYAKLPRYGQATPPASGTAQKASAAPAKVQWGPIVVEGVDLVSHYG